MDAYPIRVDSLLVYHRIMLPWMLLELSTSFSVYNMQCAEAFKEQWWQSRGKAMYDDPQIEKVEESLW